MDLDRVAAVLRPRSSWEAIDLGFAMARRWWRPLWSGWVVVVLPVYALVWALLFDTPWLAWLLLWWLRPLFDRVPLHILSRAMFGATPRPFEVLQSLRGLLRPGVFGDLTLRRLDPTRALRMPVSQLEQLTGAARGRRLRVLTRGAMGGAMWLTLCCMFMHLAVWVGLQGLVLLMLPQPPGTGGFELMVQWFSGDGDLQRTAAAMVLCDALAFVIVEPLYVAGGFSLYLNRRTQLEGWDIELAFRRLAARVQALGAVLLLGLALWAPTATAQDPHTPDAQEAAERVLQGEDFVDEREVTHWKLKDGAELPDMSWAECGPPEAQEPQGCEAGDAVGGGAAVGMEGALWALTAMAVVLIVWLVARERHRLKGLVQRSEPLPESRFGVDIRPESLPPDIGAEAFKLWEAGQRERALGLLYRGALSVLVNTLGLVVEDGHTESDCVRLARARLPPESADWFAGLTRAWQRAAYGHRLPQEEDGRALCTSFSAHFAPERFGAAAPAPAVEPEVAP